MFAEEISVKKNKEMLRERIDSCLAHVAGLKGHSRFGAVPEAYCKALEQEVERSRNVLAKKRATEVELEATMHELQKTFNDVFLKVSFLEKSHCYK